MATIVRELWLAAERALFSFIIRVAPWGARWTKSRAVIRFKCKYYWRRQLQTLKRSLKCQTLTTCRRTWQREQTTSSPWADRGRGRQVFRVRWIWYLKSSNLVAYLVVDNCPSLCVQSSWRKPPIKVGRRHSGERPSHGEWDSCVEIRARVQNKSRPRQAIQCSCFPSYCASNRQWALPG